MNNIGKDGNATDRSLGEFWEDVFIKMARSYGWRAWAFNRAKGATFRDGNGKQYISPDVWILRRKAEQYVCEIKHKNLAKNDCYGFEVYREESMLSIEEDYQNQFGGVIALYVVHNHDLAGGKFVKQNNINHWHAGELKELAERGYEGRPQKTYYNGEVTTETVRIKYYPRQIFLPIQFYLDSDPGGLDG